MTLVLPFPPGVCSMCGVQILDTTYYKQTGGGDQNKAAKLKEANEELQRELREGTQADKRDAGGAGATAPALDRLAPRAAPSSRLAPGAHVTAALATAAPTGAAGLLQFQAGAWTGAKPGYFFGAGAHGVGYYPDAEQVRMASARDASAEVARAAGGAPPGHEASILSAGASAAALATAGVAPRHDPESMAAAAAAKAQLVGGTLTSSMGAAGRPVQKGGGGAGGPPPGWAYDSGSSMYYDTASQQYWDPARQLFYDCAAQTWSATPKGGGATVPATGGDGRKTRVPDKWGL